jgi:hypothetical protein
MATLTLSLLAGPAALAADYDYLFHGAKNRCNRNNERYHNGNYHRWHRGDRIGRS